MVIKVHSGMRQLSAEGIVSISRRRVSGGIPVTGYIAVAIALHISDSIEDFAEMMNIRAESLGLTDTHFTNPHGLHDDNHYTSAHDLAVISATAMNNPDFARIVGTKSINIGNGESRRTLINKNKMLSLYKDANGIKTGYTTKSGRCLVSSATKNGVTVVCVVLNISDTETIASINNTIIVTTNAIKVTPF